VAMPSVGPRVNRVPSPGAGDDQVRAVRVLQPAGDEGGGHRGADQAAALAEEGGGLALHPLPAAILRRARPPRGRRAPGLSPRGIKRRPEERPL